MKNINNTPKWYLLAKQTQSIPSNQVIESESTSVDLFHSLFIHTKARRRQEITEDTEVQGPRSILLASVLYVRSTYICVFGA
jgi:hypothetical protein